jgi:prepilin peptidase CpaA
MTLPEIVRLTIAVLLTAVLAIAAWTDIRERKIPNWTVLASLGLFVGWAFIHSLSWDFWALGAGLIAFGATFALYMARLIGAGDSKLFAAVALFAGIDQLAVLALATALFGGLVALVGFVAKPTRALVMFKMQGRGDFGRGVPYGVAIAVASAALVWAAALKPFLPPMALPF